MQVVSSASVTSRSLKEPRMDQLALEIACRDDTVLATLTGTITPGDADPMARRLAAIARRHRGRCVIDLSQMVGLCPEAVEALVRLREAIAVDGGELRLAAATPEVMRCLASDGEPVTFCLFPSLDAALAA